MNKKVLNFYGLKWNPFSNNLPKEALQSSPKIESFCFRVESLVMDGGYAMITGLPGTGKSVVLRILAQRLSAIPEVKVGVIVRPQSNTIDFYREVAELFGVELKSGNRWYGCKNLRKKWIEHIQTTLFRPVLLIDEAQEMQSSVLNELRLLASYDLDSNVILSTIFCGDSRLPEKFKSEDLIPLGSRIKVRFQQEASTKEELLKVLTVSQELAGNPNLLTKELMAILCEHSLGNIRVLMNICEGLLYEGEQKKIEQLNEKLYFETVQHVKKPRKSQA